MTNENGRRVCLMVAYSTTNGVGCLGITDSNRQYCEKLVAEGFGNVYGRHFLINKVGVEYVWQLLDTDSDALRFFNNIGRGKCFSK